MPCPFANVLGSPGQGFHSTRIGGLALNDIIGTLALAGATSYMAQINFLRSTFYWFLAAEVLHWSFGVHTAFLDKLGIAPRCDE